MTTMKPEPPMVSIRQAYDDLGRRISSAEDRLLGCLTGGDRTGAYIAARDLVLATETRSALCAVENRFTHL